MIVGRDDLYERRIDDIKNSNEVKLYNETVMLVPCTLVTSAFDQRALRNPNICTYATYIRQRRGGKTIQTANSNSATPGCLFHILYIIFNCRSFLKLNLTRRAL